MAHTATSAVVPATARRETTARRQEKHRRHHHPLDGNTPREQRLSSTAVAPTSQPWPAGELGYTGRHECPGRHHDMRGGRVVVIIPAHNEGGTVRHCVEALAAQTQVPDEVIVIADNCTDDTAEVASASGAAVFSTQGNRDKKAGALNQVLAELLPILGDDDVVMVQDADSFLDLGFVQGGIRALAADDELGAVGGTFRGQPCPPGAGWHERLLAHLQDNEYARYARDVRRLSGRCLVVTGTAAMFRASTLKQISAARRERRLPAGDGRGGVYDTSVLTEDNELSFAVMTLGYALLAPKEMTLTTEVMPTCGASGCGGSAVRWRTASNTASPGSPVATGVARRSPSPLPVRLL